MDASLLKGRRVIEVGSMLAAPFAAHILAELGAEVIKIEPPGGDPTRTLVRGGPSGTLIAYSYGKKSVCMDLSASASRAAFEKLLATADVIVHNLAPASARRLRLTYDDCTKAKPDIVYCHIRGYGAGPLENEFDDLFHALFDDGKTHIKLVKLLSTKRRGLLRSEITKTAKIDGGFLSKKLNELSEAGFIAASKPYMGKKDAILYRIIDPFLLFHLKWIAPSKAGVLNQVDKNIWYKNRQTPSYEAWAGYSFENICYLHLPGIAKSLGLDHILYISGTWEYRSP